MKKLIIKYLEQEIRPHEVRELREWLQKSENNRQIFKNFVKIQYRLNKIHPVVTDHDALKKILAQLPLEEKKESPLQLKKSSKPAQRWLSYAAIFVGIFGLGYGLFNQVAGIHSIGERTEKPISLQLDDGTVINVGKRNPEHEEQFDKYIFNQEQNKIVYQETRESSNSELLYNSLTVPYGRKFEVVLSDCSEVVLNAGSTLRYPVAFVEGRNREVFLEGEAFFKVKEDKNSPFIVHTSTMNIKVLGTNFNVNAYKEENFENSVVLVSGQISASVNNSDKKNNRESYILSPGERAVVEGESLNKETVNVEKHIAWTSGKLLFIDDSFPVIARKLERQYDVRIVNKYPSLDKITITGRLEAEEIEEVLETFQHYTPFDYIIKGNKIVITAPSKES